MRFFAIAILALSAQAIRLSCTQEDSGEGPDREGGCRRDPPKDGEKPEGEKPAKELQIRQRRRRGGDDAEAEGERPEREEKDGERPEREEGEEDEKKGCGKPPKDADAEELLLLWQEEDASEGRRRPRGEGEEGERPERSEGEAEDDKGPCKRRPRKDGEKPDKEE